MGGPEREAGGGAPSQGPGNPVVGAAQGGQCHGRPSPLSWAPGSSHRLTDHHPAHHGAWTGRVGLYLGVWTLRRWLSEGPGRGSRPARGHSHQLLRAGSHAVGTGRAHLSQVRLWVAWPPKPMGTELPPCSGPCTLEPLVAPHTGGRTERGWAGAKAGSRPAASWKPSGIPGFWICSVPHPNPTNLSFMWPPSPSPAGTARSGNAPPKAKSYQDVSFSWITRAVGSR